VYFSHRQIVLHAMGILAWFGTAPVQGRIHREDVYMPITPMFHVHGWGMPFAATLMGIKQIYPGRYVPELLLKLIRDEGGTHSHCVPTLLHMLINHPAGKDVDLRIYPPGHHGAASNLESFRLIQQETDRYLARYRKGGMGDVRP